jgi:hypothetical protein
MDDATPPLQNTYHFSFSRYNLFVMHLDMYYVHIHKAMYVVANILKRME